MTNVISDNIRKLRQQKGISQDRLSKDANLALNTIVKIETGESPNPTVETLKKIAKAMNISTGLLFALPLISLHELEKQKLIKLPNSFSGSFSGAEVFETGHNRIFLKSAEIVDSGNAVKLTVYAGQNESSGYIRSDNQSLLIEIKNFLTNYIKKSISDIYSDKIFIYEKNN